MSCYKIYHWTPKKHKGLLMLPVGVYYNRDIQKARPGDYIQFEDDTDKYAIRRIAYMELHTQIAGLISMYLYNTPLPSVIKRWKFTAVFEGNGKKAVSDNKCLVIEYNTIPEKISCGK